MGGGILSYEEVLFFLMCQLELFIMSTEDQSQDKEQTVQNSKHTGSELLKKKKKGKRNFWQEEVTSENAENESQKKIGDLEDLLQS